jgi:ethanolamine ammonia-lyase large subunit
MLGYLTTSFREHPRLRQQNKKQIATAMKKRLVALGVMNEAGELSGNGQTTDTLYAMYAKAGGDRRTIETLREEGAKKIAALAERGFDLGYGSARNYKALPVINKRMEALYGHARRALYATIDEAVIEDACEHFLRLHSLSSNRDDYLAHPASGEALPDIEAQRVRVLYPSRRPQIQIVISDGLNANAVNENLRAVLPALRKQLAESGFHVGDIDIIIENGRVRAGYQIGELLDIDAIIHLIGERPGTGLNTLSAYLTYGRDTTNCSRWHQGIDHSWTTAVCGINAKGKQAAAAAEEITRCIRRMFKLRLSGVALGAE